MVRSGPEVSFCAITTLVTGQAMHDQDQRRDHGPQDLDRGVLVELRGLVALRLAVRVAGVEHEAEHADEDHQDDPHHHLVQPVDVRAIFDAGGLEVPRDRVRRARGAERRQAGERETSLLPFM